ncbi:disease resistance protein At4g27190-like [Camellia sinensis]|uniref:disease resistance protein At4g27190-like n=1 Tax=Camellia sinensis TaxID=4442 RepID=UPI001036E600|nr:disease resistance protein At4g27190-like [Camellia sinensis]
MPMVKEVTKSANEEQLFDEVVIAVVSPDEKKIQVEIADKLGIPYGDGHGGCKILLISRFVYVCDDMGAKKKFTVEALDKEEAWNLFKEMAGISNDTSSKFYSTQKAVADEYGGLPVAIKIVARALKGKGEPSWDSALGQLQRSIIKSIRGVEDQIFKSLELSYNSLESKEAQKKAVADECGGLPVAIKIVARALKGKGEPSWDSALGQLQRSIIKSIRGVEDQILLDMGLGMNHLKALIQWVRQDKKFMTLLMTLKITIYLMDSEENECVKMHDVIGNVAISIAFGEELLFMLDCNADLNNEMEEV